MKHPLSRREFLQLAAISSLGLAFPRFTLAPDASQAPSNGKNILIIVFDALSARNISLYGYSRETMPNLARLSERAIVYRRHFAGGPFTTPGTASLLTGTLPWTHRAIQHNGRIAESLTSRNIFNAFPAYFRIAYTHNPLVNTLFDQLSGDMETYVPRDRLFLSSDGLVERLYKEDEDIATVSWVRTIKRKEEGFSYSLYLSHLYEYYRERQIKNLKPLFPRGLPNISGDNYFLLEQSTDWLRDQLDGLPQPFLGYFHFLPPHFPYKTHRDFFGQFEKDGFSPPQKPEDPLTQRKSPDNLLRWRSWYDEFILYVDREFGRLFSYLEESGLLESTWVLFTSDHGEMFERGISGHLTSVLFQPLVHIPLLVFEPGRQRGMDIEMPTSAIDVLPTLLQASGQSRPEWAEGTVLPPFASSSPDPERSLYAVQAKESDPAAPLTQATLTHVKGRYKLMYFFGFERLGGSGERVLLYDLEADPEELKDLYPGQKALGDELLAELKAKLAEADHPFRS
jgi:arylsulfatase A-like enzyme